MIKKVLGLINQLISLLRVSQTHPVLNENGTKDKYQNILIKGAHQKKCYYCRGAGILNTSSKLDGLEFSGRMGFRDINTFSNGQCPLCKGTGFIDAQDQAENH